MQARPGLEVDEGPDEISVSVRRSAAPDRTLDVALAGCAWLTLAAGVALARALSAADGHRWLDAGPTEVETTATCIALAILAALTAGLAWTRFVRHEGEVIRTDGRTLWHEVRGRAAGRTATYAVESIRGLGILDGPEGRWAARRARWWPAPRLAFELGARRIELARGLDDASAGELLERLAPWIERGDDTEGRTQPHGASLAPTVAPELGSAAVRCARCGAERFVELERVPHGEPAIGWCDGCGAWVELARDDCAHAASGLRTTDDADGVPRLELPASTNLATASLRVIDRLSFPAAALVLLGVVAIVTGDAPGRTLTLGRALTIGGALALSAAVTVALARAIVWLTLPLPPHRIVLRPSGMSVEWRRGPLLKSARFGYERTTEIAALPPRVTKPARQAATADRWRVRMRSGPRVVTIAERLDAGSAQRLAASIRAAAAHAAWRRGRIPGWVPRHELVCPECRGILDERPGPIGRLVEATVCAACEREWPVTASLAPSLGRMDVEPPPGDALTVTATSTLGAIVTIRARSWPRRLLGLVPPLVLGAAALAALRVVTTASHPTLWTLAVAGASASVLWLGKVVAAVSTRAIEIRVDHHALTLRRVRLLGSTARRIPIERVLAVERRRAAPRAEDTRERTAAVCLRWRRGLGVRFFGSGRMRLATHLSAPEQVWLVTTLDRIVFETAFAPAREALGAGVTSFVGPTAEVSDDSSTASAAPADVVAKLEPRAVDDSQPDDRNSRIAAM